MSLTDDERARLMRLVDWTQQGRNESDLALGWLRYEALRKVSPRVFGELHRRNLAGENFDAMVTGLVIGRVLP